MKKIMTIAAASLAAITSTHAFAADANGLDFGTLEFQQSRDPLLAANQSADIVEQTPHADLANAAMALNRAIPAGTPRAAAEAILRKAGARCVAQAGASETCSYFDVKTRDPYVDAVHWNVRLDLADDRVNALAVDRSWVRD